MSYFVHASAADTPRTYPVTEDLLQVMAVDTVPEHLRELALELGAGSAMSSPHMLQRDLVNLWHARSVARNIRGPATASLLGGSVSEKGDLEATGVAFSVSGGFVGFVAFAIPAALLVPGGGFYVAYRLYRLVRDTSSLRRYARVSRAAPHVAIAVAASDAVITRDEARLLRDLLRGRVGSHAERFGLLKLELDPQSKQDAAFAALATMELDTEDWSALLAIAIATAHADDSFSDEERALIQRFEALTGLAPAAFAALAAAAEADYLLRCHLGEAMMRAVYQITCASSATVPEDAMLLLDVVLCAAVPGDAARAELTGKLLRGELQAMTRDELTRGASDERPTLFQRMKGVQSASVERVVQFGRTMALYLATLEQWRGWVERDCRTELVALGKSYGLTERQMLGWLREAHRNTTEMRPDWNAPRPWQQMDDPEPDVVALALADGAFGVTGLTGGRFRFQRPDDTHSEWQSSETAFDAFCRTTLMIEVEEVRVQADDMTFELLVVMVESHGSEVRITRAD